MSRGSPASKRVATAALALSLALPPLPARAAANYNMGAFWRKPILPLNFEVPIEMIGKGLASRTSAGTFERSKIPLTTTDYDGTVTYSFEITATNGDGVDRAVTLVNQAGTAVSTINVTASTPKAKRFRATFTPTVGTDNYYVRIAATTAANRVLVYFARMIVHQVGATKTRIYIPLMGYNYSTTGNSTEVLCPIGDCVNTTGYSQSATGHYHIWKKLSASWKSLQGSTPWRFEFLAATNNTGPSKVVLYNLTDATAVAATEVSMGTTASATTLYSVDFADGATNFDSGDEFEVRALGSTGNYIALARAGLWVSLHNLETAEVYYRACNNYPYQSGPTGNGRVLVDTSVFTTPSVFFEASLFGDTTVVSSLYDDSTSDNGDGTGSAISGSTLSITGAKARARSGALTITSGNRVKCYSDGFGAIDTGLVVIKFGS